MNLLLLLALVAVGALFLNARDQRQRIALLGGYLGKYQIEQLMENVTDGYLRALGEADATRQAQVWNMLGSAEITLFGQFNAFASEFSKVPQQSTLVSTLPLALPYATSLFPKRSFDMRGALRIHAQGIETTANNTALSQKDKAYTLSAELFLMQHTCHWFCRSKAIANARMLARHKTPLSQLVASVSPQTRQANLALVSG